MVGSELRASELEVAATPELKESKVSEINHVGVRLYLRDNHRPVG